MEPWVVQLLAVVVACISVVIVAMGGTIARDRYVFRLIKDNADVLHERINRVRDEGMASRISEAREFNAVVRVLEEKVDRRLDEVQDDVQEIRVELARRGYGNAN